MSKQKWLALPLAVAALLSLYACANTSGLSSRENSTPSAYETGFERGSQPRFPVGSRNTAPE